MKAANSRASARPKPGAPTFASFASLRLSENRRLNEEANLSQRRKGAKAIWLATVKARAQIVCRGDSIAAGVDAHPAEIAAEAWLEVIARHCVEWLPR